MHRFRTLNSLAYLLAGTIVLTACGGGSHGSLPATKGITAPGGGTPVQPATATFSFSFPKSTSARTRTALGTRAPRYLSSATKSISIQVTDTKNAGDNSDIYANVPAGLKAVQSANFANLTGNPNTPGQCGTDPSNAGNYKCTATFQMPIGIDTTTIASWDANGGTGNKLSQQIANFTTVQGILNNFTVSLDGNAATITINGSQPCQNGPVGSVFGSVGTSTVNFSTLFADGATKTIVAPGLPTISILGSDAAYHTDSGTINATGGTVSFTINQSAQSFTLTPNAVPISNASINIKGTPHNGTDGLTFSVTKTFTFSAGTAPPAHNFLAAVEQGASNTGVVDFFNVTLGGSGGPDSFSTYATAPTLAVTNSTNENKPDVDNPESLTWDTNGDILIGNGHDGSVNSGNMACVPVGAIATGANTSTTVSSNVSSPVGIAYDSRDGSVALANEQPGATYNLSEYLLTGNYTAAPAAQNIKVNQTNLGSNGGIANITDLPAGSYAIALSDGVEMDSLHNSCTGSSANPGHSEVAVINGATHVVTHISDPDTSGTACTGTSAHGFAVDLPWGLAWDATNHQLAIANNSQFHHTVSFYSSSGTFVQSINVLNKANWIAASPDGHIAVARAANFLGYPQVQVYDNTASRNPVSGPIPFNGESAGCGGGGTHIYPAANIHQLVWLSNTKLLIALETTTASENGLYIFDISTTAVPAGTQDSGGCPAFAAAPQQTAFQQLSLKPLAAAFKP